MLRITKKYMKKICEPKMWTLVVSKSYEQNLQTKAVSMPFNQVCKIVLNKICKEKLWTKAIDKRYEQKLWTKVMNKSCEQKL